MFAAPPNEVDIKLNEYEKVSNQFVRVAKQMKEGDVSVTLRYIELGQTHPGGLREAPARSGKDDAPTGAKTGRYFG